MATTTGRAAGIARAFSARGLSRAGARVGPERRRRSDREHAAAHQAGGRFGTAEIGAVPSHHREPPALACRSERTRRAERGPRFAGLGARPALSGAEFGAGPVARLPAKTAGLGGSGDEIARPGLARPPMQRRRIAARAGLLVPRVGSLPAVGSAGKQGGAGRARRRDRFRGRDPRRAPELLATAVGLVDG